MKKLIILFIILLAGVTSKEVNAGQLYGMGSNNNSNDLLSYKVSFQPPSRSKAPPQSKRPLTQSLRSRAMTPSGWEFGGNIGTSHSLTEIGGRRETSRGFIMDTQFETTSLSIGAFSKYRFNYWFSAELNFNYAHIHGADSLSPINSSRYARGFYFNNNIYELAAKGIVYAPRIVHKTPLDIYGYLGIAGFYHNPELNVPDPDNYNFEDFSKIQVAFPMGVGAYYTFQKQYKVGIDIGWRKTFTDYLNGFTRPASQGYDSYYFMAFRFSYFINPTRRSILF